MRHTRWWAGRDRKDRSLLAGLGALLLAGTALRLALVLTARPAFLGLPDSFWYVAAAQRNLFLDPLHPAGYPLFLRALHGLSSHLTVAIVAQHLLGLAAGVLLFLVARRLAGPTWWVLLPAATILVGGSEVFIEHAVVSESLFIFLQAGALYTAVRALDGSRLAWGAATGLLAGMAVIVRPAGIVTAAVLAVWLIAATADRPLRRVASGAVAALCAVLVVTGYVAVQNDRTGQTAIPRASGWYLYGRAAPFADCHEFTPPSGTARLCERIPPDRRPGPTNYVFDPASPAVRAFGNPLGKPLSRPNPKPGEFGRAALVGQPLDWLALVVGEDLPRFVYPGLGSRDDKGPGYGELMQILIYHRDAFSTRVVSDYYGSGPEHRSGAFSALRIYEKVTRANPVVSFAAILLMLAGVLLFPRGGRIRVSLPALVALAGVVGTAVSWGYDARYALAAQGPMAVAAAIGGALVWQRAKIGRGKPRAHPAEPGASLKA